MLRATRRLRIRHTTRYSYDKPIPRSEVTKRVWDYIKANGLQDQTNKRMINADDKLLKIFNGKKQVSMFEMTALVSKHLKA